MGSKPIGMVEVYIHDPASGKIIQIPCITAEIELNCSMDDYIKGTVTMEIVGNLTVHYNNVEIDVGYPLLENKKYLEGGK